MKILSVAFTAILLTASLASVAEARVWHRHGWHHSRGWHGMAGSRSHVNATASGHNKYTTQGH